MVEDSKFIAFHLLSVWRGFTVGEKMVNKINWGNITQSGHSRPEKTPGKKTREIK